MLAILLTSLFLVADSQIKLWWAAGFRIATVFFARSRVQPPSSGDAGPAVRLTPENENITISGHFEGSTRMSVCKAVTELVSTSVDQVCPAVLRVTCSRCRKTVQTDRSQQSSSSPTAFRVRRLFSRITRRHSDENLRT
jgi:hypothetical protein